MSHNSNVVALSNPIFDYFSVSTNKKYNDIPKYKTTLKTIQNTSYRNNFFYATRSFINYNYKNEPNFKQGEMRLKLSFIIPCYNSAQYIDNCLNSIYQQDVEESCYEVICINDYSTDNTQQILDKWQTTHSNLHCINHQTNRKQSAARNTGLHHAKGDYIWFVDSDDTIQPNCLAFVLKTIEDNNLDLLLFNPTTPQSYIYQQPTPNNGVQYMENWVRTKKLSNTMYCIWARIIKRKLIETNQLWLCEDICMVEDVSYSYKLCCYSQRLMAIPNALYSVQKVAKSVTRSPITAQKLFSAVFLNPQELLEVAEYAKQFSPYVASHIVGDAQWWLSRLLNTNSLFAKASIRQQLHFIKLCNANATLINTITQKAGINRNEVYTNGRLYRTIASSLIKREAKRLLKSRKDD